MFTIQRDRRYPRAVDDERALGVLGLLTDDIRRRLYQFVRRSEQSVTREEAAKEISISAKLAAFHLDKLVQGGLLDSDFDTPVGSRRRVGHAPKRYRASSLQVMLSLPQRRYDLVGEILIGAFSNTHPDDPPAAAARQVAFERGRQIGTDRRQQLGRGRLGAERTVGESRGLLEELGFEPADDAAGGLVLRNCPFHALAKRDPQLVCALNASFIDGILRGLGNSTVSAELVPQEGMCCVRVCQHHPVPGGTASRT